MTAEPLRVLIVDRDEPHSRLLHRAFLEAGCPVAHVEHLLSCVRHLERDVPDVVLVGSTVDGARPALPVLLGRRRPLLFYMTTVPNRGLHRIARAAGYDDGLTKIVAIDEVIRRVHRYRRVVPSQVAVDDETSRR